MLRTDDADLHAQDALPEPKPYSGWTLDRAITLDRACPGLLAASMYFGAARRQALFLVLAKVFVHGAAEIAGRLRCDREAGGVGHDQVADTVIGHAVLRLRRPRDLVRAVLGTVPVGLLGAMRRLGGDPLSDPASYVALYRLFASGDPVDRRRCRVLGQISGSLVGAQIHIVGALDPALLHPALVATLYEAKQVPELHRALAYIRAHCSAATDDAIRASITRLKPGSHRGDLIKAWAARFDRLPRRFDTGGDPTLIVLDNASKIVEAARRYANCLKSKMHESVLGSYVYVEYRPLPSTPGLIVELRRTSRGYLLEGLYSPGNKRVPADQARQVRKKLAALGVALLDHAPGDPEQVQAAARMLGMWNFTNPDTDGWGLDLDDAVDDLRDTLAEAA